MAEKLGLALSGGGFRASFYHIGVLAQMAEQGLLKEVQVISTVSGGSIIGALYYLHVKKLLEEKDGKAIEDKDYIKLVENVEREFFEGTKKNIRMKTFSNVFKNFKMLSATYSRTDRLGELYNEHFYKNVLTGVGCPQMQQLRVQPKDGIIDNSKRKAKIPTLVINATTLNTGGNWQFTVENMGEYPIDDGKNGLIAQINRKKIRLRRPDSYAELPSIKGNLPWDTEWDHRQTTLGEAVAASACVPGLFTPLSITGLYKDGEAAITPLLVDGGVFDNQGVHGLQENGCTHFVVSDACGQMAVEKQMDNNPAAVLLRVSSVLQDRVRAECLEKLVSLHTEANIAFLDLRHGLGTHEIAVQGTAQTDSYISPSSQNFQVDPRVQNDLSLMRTDLDAFTEVEAYSLMMDGYLMSETPLNKFAAPGFSRQEHTWQFKDPQIAAQLANPSDGYLEQLKIAKMIGLKALVTFPIPLGGGTAFVLAALLYFYYPAINEWLNGSIANAQIAMAVLGLAGTAILNALAPKLTKFFSIFEKLRSTAEFFKRLASVTVLVLFGAVICNFYLLVINPMFLRHGKIKNLK